jgi:hypothetical protein
MPDHIKEDVRDALRLLTPVVASNLVAMFKKKQKISQARLDVDRKNYPRLSVPV